MSGAVKEGRHSQGGERWLELQSPRRVGLGYVWSAPAWSCRQLSCGLPVETPRARLGAAGGQAVLPCVCATPCHARVSMGEFGVGRGPDICLMSPFILWDSTAVSQCNTWWSPVGSRSLRGT